MRNCERAYVWTETREEKVFEVVAHLGSYGNYEMFGMKSAGRSREW